MWRLSILLMLPVVALARENVSLNVSMPLPVSVEAGTSRLAFSGPDHVVRRPSGDVLIEGIPMIDQGDKGYCVVASVERVLRYYGLPADENELARISKSDIAAGTKISGMMSSLNRLSESLGVKVRSLYTLSVQGFVSAMTDYNRAAKRANGPQVNLGGRVIDVDDCLSSVSLPIYREVRLKRTGDFRKFQLEIQRAITEGRPVLWSVRLGLVPEKGLPQVFGGHMRLIIGYNAGTGTIIYTDSWGPGHEEERMSVQNAWTITTGLNCLEPVRG